MMITASEINWKLFCYEDEEYYGLNNPFVSGGYKYATDRKIAIRVKSDDPDDYLDGKKRPNIESVFTKLDACNGEFVSWPPESEIMNSVVPTECRKCIGCGRQDTHRCEKCEGEGTVECSMCFHEDECNACGGYGINGGTTCTACKGSGECVQPERIKCGTLWCSAINDEKIRTLPNPRFCHDDLMIFVKFDGGEAIVASLAEDS